MDMETRKKILIVDDEQINVEFFDLMLSKLGFIVERPPTAVTLSKRSRNSLPT